jgi:hypothetical protein
MEIWRALSPHHHNTWAEDAVTPAMEPADCWCRPSAKHTSLYSDAPDRHVARIARFARSASRVAGKHCGSFNVHQHKHVHTTQQRWATHTCTPRADKRGAHRKLARNRAMQGARQTGKATHARVCSLPHHCGVAGGWHRHAHTWARHPGVLEAWGCVRGWQGGAVMFCPHAVGARYHPLVWHALIPPHADAARTVKVWRAAWCATMQ